MNMRDLRSGSTVYNIAGQPTMFQITVGFYHSRDKGILRHQLKDREQRSAAVQVTQVSHFSSAFITMREFINLGSRPAYVRARSVPHIYCKPSCLAASANID